MISSSHFAVDGYQLAADRYYDEETHLWVAEHGTDRVRCGFDPLGSETSGDIVAVSFEEIGTRVERGAACGSLEAAKFVGPLHAPVAGTIRAHNAAVVASPGLINEDPFAHWLIELEVDDLEAELAPLLHGPDRVREWFERELERFQHKGMIAE